MQSVKYTCASHDGTQYFALMSSEVQNSALVASVWLVDFICV